MDKLRVGYACLARLSFDGEYAVRLMEKSAASLDTLDVELIHKGELTLRRMTPKRLPIISRPRRWMSW